MCSEVCSFVAAVVLKQEGREKSGDRNYLKEEEQTGQYNVSVKGQPSPRAHNAGGYIPGSLS